MTFPIQSEEYGSYRWLLREVGSYMEYGEDSQTWTHTQKSFADSIIESGVYQFYFPSPSEFTIPDATEAQKERLRRAPHAWTFLQKIASIEIVAGQTEYELPLDFANFIGEPTSTRSTGRIAFANESHIRQLLGSDSTTGPPKYCASSINNNAGSARPSWELVVYPTPAAAETIQVQYGVSPTRLSDDLPWPLSGLEHAETLKVCCLSVAEERKGKGEVIYATRARERMAASIMMDQQSAAATSDGIWPEDSPTDLAMGRKQFEKRIGLHLGLGPNSELWTDAQKKKVQEVYHDGVRMVIDPMVLPREKYPHQWSWLIPTRTLVTQPNVFNYDLPEDFAFFDGPLTFSPESNTLYGPLQIESPDAIVALQQRQTGSSHPIRAAYRAKDTVDQEPTRYEIIFWPTPNAEYSLHYRYRISPDAIASENSQFMRGGKMYTQLLLQACLLAADMNDKTPMVKSGHYESFIQCLISAVGQDRLLKMPKRLGYNGDRSNDDYLRDRHEYQDGLVTYNGRADY